MGKKTNQRFQASLSFSGKNRELAEALKRKLRRKKINVFIDSEHLAELAGHDSDKLREIYGQRSDVVIPLISSHYKKSPFTQVEIESALEAEQRGEARVIPIQLDTTRQFGINKDRMFLDPDRHSIDEMVDAIAQACRDIAGSPQRKSNAVQPIPILEADTRRALGILAYSRLPVTQNACERIFPDIQWKTKLRHLMQHGHVQVKDNALKVKAKSKKSILADDAEKQGFREDWKSALEPLCHYMDMAPHMSLIYLDEGKLVDAIQLLVDVANGVDLGFWNDIYISAFQNMVNSKGSRKLGPQLWLEMLHALGKCLCHDKQFDSAIEILKRAKSYAKRRKDAAWLGRVLLTLGVVHHEQGDFNKAAEAYEEAFAIAEKISDAELKARAQGNLATIKQFESPHLAKQLLEESIQAKRSIKDTDGLAVATFQLGTIEANDGNPKRAIEHFQESLQLQKQNGEGGRPTALTLYNLGLAHFECGQNVKALGFVKKSLDEALLAGLPDIEMMALVVLGMACFQLKRFEQLVDYSDKLLEVAKNQKHIENQTCALHGRGIAKLLLDEVDLGRKSIRAALKIARKENLLDWAARCITDLTREVKNKTIRELNVRKVVTAAKSEARKENRQLAAVLWVMAANLSHLEKVASADEFDCLKEAWQLLEDVAELDDDLIYSLKQIHHGFWRSQQFEVALVVHKRIEDLVRDGTLSIEFRNSRGCLLIELERFEEAEGLFANLIVEVREMKSPELLSMILHNLGECYRQSGQFEEAMESFEESENCSLTLKKPTDVIATMHNRALAYQHQGDFEFAIKLLEQCRDKAKRKNIWYEYVRAWEALAGVALQQDRFGLARSRYEKAFAEAKKHKFPDCLSRISLNFSNLLYHEGESKKGLKLLLKCRSEFDERSDSYLYYFAMGLCYEDLNQLDNAVDAFETAKERARKFGDFDNVISCLSHVVGIELYRKQDTSELIGEIEMLQSSLEDVAIKLGLLEVLLRIAIESEDDGLSQSVYDDGHELCEQNDIPHAMVDLNLVVAEHNWRTGEHDKRQEAMRIFADSFAHAIVFDLDCDELEDEEFEYPDDSMFEVIVGRVTSLVSLSPDNASPEEFERLLHDLMEEERKASKSELDTIKMIMQPFEMMKRLIPFADNPKRQLVEIDKFINEND